MTRHRTISALTIALMLTGLQPALAQEVGTATAPEVKAADAVPAPDKFLKVYFPTGSSRIDGAQSATLDQAARTFRDGDPFVMIV